jgi:diaminopimelate epimerase
MARLTVTKVQGSGNDFVLLDNRAGGRYAYAGLARHLCDRRFGVGADGLLVLACPSGPAADASMRIFNADGSEAEMCGNGIRCVARYLYEREAQTQESELAIETPSGIVHTEVLASLPRFAVRAAMGVPEDVRVHDAPVKIGDVRADVVDVLVGNPHSVAFVDVDVECIDLEAMAPEIAAAGPFRNGVNVEVARIGPDGIAMRVFERGVGETLACGTGACAVAVAAIATGRAASPVRIDMRGGSVDVEWSGSGTQARLTGGAEIVFDAEVDVPEAFAATPATSSM